MALASGDYTALNTSQELEVDNERNGTALVQYPDGGAGTLELQATLDEITWEPLEVTDVSDSTNKITAIAAAGIYYAELLGFKKIRLKKTVGAAAITPVWGISYN